MRRIAIINQKGGVGKTTTAVNLGAALARLGRRVVVIDMDPQANASMNLGAELGPDEPSTYSILTQGGRVADTLSGTSTPGLSVIPAHLDLSGAELELASAIGRETILRDALDEWEDEEMERTGRAPADVILIDNPPSLGLLSVNGLAASKEVLIAVQTEFFALQGLSKLVEIVQLLRRRLNPDLEITGVLACMYDSRLRLAREVLGELRTHFPGQVFRRPIAQNVKLAETPSFARTIFEYAPESKGAEDYLAVAREFLEREGVTTDADGRAIETASEPDVAAEPPAARRTDTGPGPEARDEPATEPDDLPEVDVPAAPRAPAGATIALDRGGAEPGGGASTSSRTPAEDGSGEGEDARLRTSTAVLVEDEVGPAPRPAQRYGAEPMSGAEPVAGPLAEPVAEPVATPVAGDIAEEANEPEAEPAGEPMAESAPAPPADPASRATAEPPAQSPAQATRGPLPQTTTGPIPNAEDGPVARAKTEPDPGPAPGSAPASATGPPAVADPEPSEPSASADEDGTGDLDGPRDSDGTGDEVTPAPRLRTPVRTRRDDRGEERAETPGRRAPAR